MLVGISFLGQYHGRSVLERICHIGIDRGAVSEHLPIGRHRNLIPAAHIVARPVEIRRPLIRLRHPVEFPVSVQRQIKCRDRHLPRTEIMPILPHALHIRIRDAGDMAREFVHREYLLVFPLCLAAQILRRQLVLGGNESPFERWLPLLHQEHLLPIPVLSGQGKTPPAVLMIDGNGAICIESDDKMLVDIGPAEIPCPERSVLPSGIDHIETLVGERAVYDVCIGILHKPPQLPLVFPVHRTEEQVPEIVRVEPVVDCQTGRRHNPVHPVFPDLSGRLP